MSGPFILGLTGGIGSGKSAAADLFAELGATVVDTDRIAHQLTGPGGAAMPALVQAFGQGIAAPDGALDRTAMRRLAFGDAAARSRLEGILHPLIREESARQCRAAATPVVVLVVPLLVESGTYRSRVHRLAVVDCREETQLARVMARSRLSAAEVRAIMSTQASRAERLAAADLVIDNDGPREALRPQVEKAYADCLAAASRL